MSRLVELSTNRLGAFHIQDELEWTGEHRAVLPMVAGGWVGSTIFAHSCPQTTTKFVVLDETHLRAMELYTGLRMSTVERRLRDVVAERDELARLLRATHTRALPKGQPEKAAIDEAELAKLRSDVETVAHSVFGEPHVRGVTTTAARDGESTVSHDIVVTVEAGQEFDPAALAQSRHTFFGAVAQAVPGTLLSRVQVLVEVEP
ncbi:MAG: hypothetical protein IPF77_11430 [Gemmatimonadetes bacterium]|nr:hypothetical protein [Gemmatimonadota bacterium]